MRSWCHASLRSSRRICADIVTVPAPHSQRIDGVDEVPMVRALLPKASQHHTAVHARLLSCAAQGGNPAHRMSDALGPQGDDPYNEDPPAWRPVGHKGPCRGASLTRAAEVASAVLLGGRSVPHWPSRASGRSRRGRPQGRRPLLWQVRWPRSRRTRQSQTIHRH